MLGIRKKEVTSVAVSADKKVIGTCEVSRRRTTDERDTGFFGTVVLDRYRGKRIGQMMVKIALKEARRSGVWLVELQVFAFNEVAIHVPLTTHTASRGALGGRVSD